jgi:hypothetical protein
VRNRAPYAPGSHTAATARPRGNRIFPENSSDALQSGVTLKLYFGRGETMAEKTVIVCDVCGKPAQQSVTFRVGSRSLVQDLCGTHLQELIRRSHAPKRGRRPGPSADSPTASARRRVTRAASPASSRKRASAKSTRRRITDPAALEKRRAALGKAREVLAKKRAAQKAG